jgi:hypothetical protein
MIKARLLEICKEPRPKGRGSLLVLHFEETGSHSLATCLMPIGAILNFPTVSSPLIQILGKLLIKTHLIGAKRFK